MDKSESGVMGISRDIRAGCSIRSTTSSPTVTPSLAASESLRTIPSLKSSPEGLLPGPSAKKRPSRPSTSILFARFVPSLFATIPCKYSTGATFVLSFLASSSANPAVKKRLFATRARFVLPSRAFIIILRLWRTESPTTRAPVRIAVLVMTASRTPRFVLQ